MRFLPAIFWLVLLGGGAPWLSARASAAAPPVIVLKLDDVTDAPYARGGFERAFRLLKKYQLAASFGIITRSCVDDGTRADYFSQLRRWSDSGLIELWHHGWDHQRGEFTEHDAAEQARRLREGLEVVRQATGVEMRTFGAPYNETSDATLTALNATTGIRVWFGPAAASGKAAAVVLHERAPLERKVGVVSYDLFVEGFEQRRHAAYLVLVAHPPYWDEASHREFERVLNYCRAQGCRFATPLDAATWLTRP